MEIGIEKFLQTIGFLYMENTLLREELAKLVAERKEDEQPNIEKRGVNENA